jgi:hypothetical protein
MMQRFRFVLVASAVAALAGNAFATPYAANVRNTGGTTWEFVLNEGADSITVKRNGANPVNFAAPAAGRYTFDMAGFSSFDIEVAKNAPVGWTPLNDATNAYTNFTQPNSVAVNTKPNSPFFGTVYVANANPANTSAGRLQGDGIYALTPDLKGVDLTNFSVPAATDITQFKHPGFDVAGSTSSSPYRIVLDDGGNLIVGDWSDPSGGVKYASRDLTTGGVVLGGTDLSGNPIADGSGTGPAGGIFSQQTDEFGRIPLHGSVVAKPVVTGTVGSNLTLWTMDEDLDVELAAPNNDGNSIWKYNIGAATNYDAMAPTLVVNSKLYPKTSDNRISFFGDVLSVAADMIFDPTFNKWYISQPRSAGDQPSLMVIQPGADGTIAPTILWSSLQHAIDNNLDSDATLPAVPTGTSTDLQDPFRRVRGMAISPDKKFMVLQRNAADVAHNGIGAGSVIVIPLDANGIPMLTTSGNDITNAVTINTIGSGGSHISAADVVFDAAGNIYVTNSSITAGQIGQIMQVFSPGGNTLARTSGTSAGGINAFLLVPPSAGITGDYNGNGVVDAADYVVWRNAGPTATLPNDSSPGTVDVTDYNNWRANFGKPPGSGSGSAVPEPTALLLAGLGLLFASARRQKRS